MSLQIKWRLTGRQWSVPPGDRKDNCSKEDKVTILRMRAVFVDAKGGPGTPGGERNVKRR